MFRIKKLSMTLASSMPPALAVLFPVLGGIVKAYSAIGSCWQHTSLSILEAIYYFQVACETALLNFDRESGVALPQ